MKNSEVRHPQGDRFIKTYNWQLLLLAPLGKTASCGADLLSFFEYWYNHHSAGRSPEEKKKIMLEFSFSYIRQSLFNRYSRNTLTKALEYLDQEQLVAIIKGENGTKNKYQFLVDRVNFQADLFVQGQPFVYVHQFKNEQVTCSNLNSPLLKVEQVTGSKLNRYLLKVEQESCSNLNSIIEVIELLKKEKNSQRGESEIFYKNFFSQPLLSDWQDWKNHLLEKHQMTYTQNQEKHALKNLIELSNEVSKNAQRILTYSIQGGWKTLCVPNGKKSTFPTGVFPNEWNKAFFDKLDPKQHAAYYRHLRAQGLRAKKNNKGEIITWEKAQPLPQ